MIWAQIALLILQDAPAIVAVLQKWISIGQTPTIEDLQAELSQLGIDDAALTAAYQRLFPGQNPPQA